ncbi:MAG: DNA-directed RNA polymerase [Methanopyri archaeon]|jgi:DNA-directed RNA polymerase subunit E'|nr:DNA-directed RNA polymerase [Methanopyri archaeon]
MYKLVSMRDSVRVDPALLGKKPMEAVDVSLRKAYEGLMDRQVGVVLCITKVESVGEGKIIPGDAGVYYDTVFEMLIYRPELHEVVEGTIIEIVDFGAFIRLGPIDGLVHISQITDDYISYSKDGVLMGRESKRVLKSGDKVRARIITVSYKHSQSAKVGLTMRQPGLGKIDWAGEEEGGVVLA